MPQRRARKELLSILDLTIRQSDASREDIERACREARASGLSGICLNSSRLLLAAHCLEESPVKLTCAVGYPHGTADADVKRYETETAVDHGAHFIEVSANLGRLKDGDTAGFVRELRDVVEAADERAVSLHLDAALVTGDELRRAAQAALEASVKGITFAAGLDATTAAELLRLVREMAGDKLGLKVEQGSLTIVETATLLEAGATRFGLREPAGLLAALPAAD